MPKLEATMHHLPESLYAGNLRRLALELRNSSNTPVKVSTSNISFACVLKKNKRYIVITC